MKKKSQNRVSADGSGSPSQNECFAAAETDARQGETRGQKFGCRVQLSPVGLEAVVRTNWLSAKIFQIHLPAISAQAGFIQRGNGEGCRGQEHRHKYLLMSKDVLPKKCHFSRVLAGLGRDDFERLPNKEAGSFWQTASLT